ncbi:MAG: FG-GAP repeat domain-containing protein [bacterium]
MFRKTLRRKGFGFLYPYLTIYLFLLAFAFFLFNELPFISVRVSARDYSCPLVEEIAAFFPVLEGYIVEVKGDMIFLDLGRPSGVRKGMEFLCIREGEEFTHPMTGAVLGRFEDKLGYIQVTEISENYSIGKIQQNFSGKVIKRGDKIRITASKIPIALPSDLKFNPNIEAFVKGLEQNGRFTIIPRASIVSTLNDIGLSDFNDLTSEQIKRISEKLDISAIIIPSMEESTRKNFIHVRIISARTGASITQLSYECGEDRMDQLSNSVDLTNQTPQGSGDMSGRFSVPLQGEITDISHLSQHLDFSIIHMAIGDVTGNGINEVCVSDGRNIFLYSWEKDRLEKIAEVKGTVSENHLSMDIADINGNGCAEIYVSNMEKDSLQSFVMEWQNGNLEKIWSRAPLFLKVMTVYLDQRIILGQSKGIAEPFDTKVNEYKWGKDGFVPANEVDLPQKLNILNIGMADMDGDGNRELIYLDDKELSIYRNGKKIWKSDCGYGGRTLFFEYKPKGALVTSDVEIRVYLPSHLSIQDINENGKPDIMVIKNTSSTGGLFPQSRLYRKGEACLIEWNGLSFAEVWCSGEIDAYLTDVAIGDINHDNNEDLVLSMVLVSGIDKFWEKNPSKVLFY